MSGDLRSSKPSQSGRTLGTAFLGYLLKSETVTAKSDAPMPPGLFSFESLRFKSFAKLLKLCSMRASYRTCSRSIDFARLELRWLFFYER